MAEVQHKRIDGTHAANQAGNGGRKKPPHSASQFFRMRPLGYRFHPKIDCTCDLENDVVHRRKADKLVEGPEELILQYKAETDESKRILILDQIIRHYDLFIRAIAQQYDVTKHNAINTEDLIQEGKLGLINALNKYDPAIGRSFSSYAFYWIHSSMSRFIINQGSTIYIPSYLVAKIRRANRAIQNFFNNYGREPSADEYIIICGMTKEKLDYMSFITGDGIVSLEVLPSFCAESQSMSTPSTAIDDRFFDSHSIHDIIESLRVLGQQGKGKKGLTEKEYQALLLRFGLGENSTECNYEEIGSVLNVTRQRAEQLVGSALRKLRMNLSHS